MMKKNSILNEGQIKKSAKEKQELIDQMNKENAETKAMENIFSGSCCHSGMHAYTPRKKNEQSSRLNEFYNRT